MLRLLILLSVDYIAFFSAIMAINLMSLTVDVCAPED